MKEIRKSAAVQNQKRDEINLQGIIEIVFLNSDVDGLERTNRSVRLGKFYYR